MGLAVGVAIVTASEVAQITQEPALASLNQGSDATLANLVVQATTALIFELQLRGITDPSTIGDTTLLKLPAAWWCAWRTFAGMPVSGDAGAVNTQKTKTYRDLFDRDISRVVLSILDTSTGQPVSLNTTLGLPTSANHDAKPFVEPTDNRIPYRSTEPYWTSR